ncbi:MAG: hypothetical protein GC193_03365 [Cryomorphaceae bacterium]|nr:hypothetical protein [Cryomorphaceae bacterium]
MIPKDGMTPKNETFWTKTYYIRDAAGNPLTHYTQTMPTTTTHLTQTSVDIYGAARLGAASLVREVSAELSNITFVGVQVYDSSVIDQRIASANYALSQLPGEPAMHMRWLGYKQYELSNHPARAGQVLGNVTATLSDAISTHFDGAVHYTSRITSLTDYYPFGAAMPGRSFSEGEYRYGFQGQETDDEIKGEGNSINYKYRMHDARIGRFFSIDPLAPDYPWNSPYAFSENKLIHMVELEGLEAVTYSDKRVDGVTVGVGLTTSNDPSNSGTPIESTQVLNYNVEGTGNVTNPNVNSTPPVDGQSSRMMQAEMEFNSIANTLNGTAGQFNGITTTNPAPGSGTGWNATLPNQFDAGTITDPGAGNVTNVAGLTNAVSNAIQNPNMPGLGISPVMANNTTKLLIITDGTAAANAVAMTAVSGPGGLSTTFGNVDFAIVSDLALIASQQGSGRLQGNGMIIVQNPTQSGGAMWGGTAFGAISAANWSLNFGVRPMIPRPPLLPLQTPSGTLNTLK